MPFTRRAHSFRGRRGARISLGSTSRLRHRRARTEITAHRRTFHDRIRQSMIKEEWSTMNTLHSRRWRCSLDCAQSLVFRRRTIS